MDGEVEEIGTPMRVNGKNPHRYRWVSQDLRRADLEFC
jgi:hypothetical protein